MSVSEAQRFEMHTALRKVMGDEVADTMMEYMPHFGWSDVARKSDIDRLDLRLDQIDKRLDQIDVRFDQVDKRFEQFDGRFGQVDKRFEQIDGRFGQVDKRFEQFDGRFDQIDKRFASVVAALWALGTITVGGFASLFAVIVARL